jgi:DNA replication protein
MKEFSGFPSGGRLEFTPVPNVFFSDLLADINDIDELKTTLHVMAALYRKKGYPRYVSFSELLENASLMQALHGSEESLREALQKAMKTGTLLSLSVSGDRADETIYLLNNEADRQALAKIESGELKLPGWKTTAKVTVQAETLPDIFTLYEQNIGMLTPMIADELRDAERIYPLGWIRDAIKEAVLHNKRNIKYINKILESWSVEGRGDGTYKRDSQKTGPDRFIKGKYGHMVRR